MKTRITSNCKINKDKLAKGIFFFFALFSVFAVFGIIFYILYESFPAFKQIGVFNFIFGEVWAPTKDFLDVSERFGIFKMIIASLAVTFGAVIIGGILGIFTAIFNTYFCPKKLRTPFNQVINLLAGIPSIVYGFFGLTVLVPLLAKISGTGSGKGLMASSLILGIMILPTVASLSKNSLESVPKSYFEGALALGNTKEQAVFKVAIPAARSGIVAGLVLGMGRAIGETMAVMMIAGNSVLYPTGLFSGIRTMTINIVLEMSYAEGLHKHALIATGFVLLVFVFLLNLSLSFLKTGHKDKGKNKQIISSSSNIKFTYCGIKAKLLKFISVSVSAFVFVLLAFIIGFVLIKGLPHINMNLLFGESGNAGMTLAPAFVSTARLILLALAIAIPVGIGGAIYLNEYSKKGSKIVKIIRMFIDTLSGIPSIVFGLFGMIVFCDYLKMGYSLLAGGMTLALIILPTIIKTTEESLMAVPNTMREGSLALGAGKVRTIFKVVLPSALSGILTSVILSIGRIVGESAALIYTSGACAYMPVGYGDAGSSFAVMMWMFAGEGLYLNSAYATAAVLLIVVAVLNIAVLFVEKKTRKIK